jgi:small subunit ribosomal protein S1
VGDKIKVQILDIDTVNKRINLSVKRTEKDKFQDAKTKYQKEQKVKGKVQDVKARGVTLLIEEGISGFISGDKIPSGITYKIGDEIEAEVVDIDERRRVIVLSPVLKAVPVGYR